MKSTAKILFLSALFFEWACTEKPKVSPPVSVYDGMYIVNEGNFDWGEGTITYWNPKTGEVRDDNFKKINGRPLGNVAQSMTKINNLGYIVVNNSQKIEVVDIENFQSLFTISNMVSPRYILPIGNNKMYVSDLYADGVYVVSDNKITQKIPVSGWTNRMVLDDKGKVWVARRRTDFDTRPGGTSVIIIDTSTNAVVDSVEIGTGIEEIEIDENGTIWTACSTFQKANHPAIVKIMNGNIQAFPTLFPVYRLRTDGENIYFLMNNALYSMSVNASVLPEKPIFSSSGQLYGLGVNTENILVTDAKDYVQRGTVFRLDKSGNKKDSVKAGVIPSEFCFID